MGCLTYLSRWNQAPCLMAINTNRSTIKTPVILLIIRLISTFLVDMLIHGSCVNFYRPRGDNTFGSVRPSVRLSVRPSVCLFTL